VPERDPYSREQVPDALQLVVRAVERAESSYHHDFVTKVERRYRAYRGLAEVPSGSGGKDTTDDWHSDITVPYILHTIEGMIATMLEPKPRFDVEPRPRPGETTDEIVARLQRSQTVEETLAYALERDSFAQKQRPFMQQDLIAGISVFKTYWASEHRNVIEATNKPIEVTDGYGTVIDSFDTLEEKTTWTQIRDDACCEVRDVRDFFWPEQAPSVEKAEWLIDRTYETLDSLKRLEKEGVYSNVDKLTDARDSQEYRDVSEREQQLRNVRRTKDLYEVLEYWTPERVITVANRKVVLRDTPNPFWNGRLPFVVCSAMPDAFQIPGVSVVEALAQLQEMLWTLQNTRLDSLQMLANVITLIRSDVDDPDAFPYEPMAQWFVEDPQQVTTLPVDPTAANITLQAEALLKGDLQNIMGGLPYAGGADSQTIDQETATGMSIITSIAQRIIQARKQHYLWCYAELGKHFLLLYQQFLREERVVKIAGPVGARRFRSITAMDLQGDFDVMIDVTGDSLMRQERRAEAQSLLQVAAGIAPIAAQLNSPLNMRAFVELALDAYDIQDKERYFLPSTPPSLAPAPPGGTGGTAPTPGGNGAGGITNPELAAGPLSPSAEGGVSMSAEAPMQRMLARSGLQQ